MRGARRVRSAAASVALAVVLAGCGDGSGGLPDASLLMRDAAISMRSVRAAHVVLTSHGAVPGFPLRGLAADVSTADGGTASGEAAEPDRTVAFVETWGSLFTRRADGTLFPVPADAGLPRPTALLGASGGLAGLIGALRRPTTVARRDFQGVDAFEIVADLPAAALAAVFPAMRRDATLTTWVRVRGAHLPLDTTIGFPSAPDATLDLRVEPATGSASTPKAIP